MREIFVTACRSPDISELTLVTGGAKSCVLSLGEVRRLFRCFPIRPSVTSAVRFFKHRAARQAYLIVNAGFGVSGCMTESRDSFSLINESAGITSANSLALTDAGRFCSCYPYLTVMAGRFNRLLLKHNTAVGALFNL